MAVFKSAVVVFDPHERSLGEGRAYIHLPRGHDVRQEATGTVTLRRWEPGDATPTLLGLEDGRRLGISVSREVLSECSRNHILRFQATWPPDDR